jgi:hypothetical protein
MRRIGFAILDFETLEGKRIQKGAEFTIERISTETVTIVLDNLFPFHVLPPVAASSIRLKNTMMS